MMKEGQRDHTLIPYVKLYTRVVFFLLLVLSCSALDCYTDNPLLNVARGKTTYASSGTTSSTTTDGNRESVYDAWCMNTASEENPWLVVDLQGSMSVSTVVLTAIQATSQLQILVGDTFEAGTFNPLTSGYAGCVPRAVSMLKYEVLHVQCESPLVGRYILIYTQQVSNLRLCEVEVYAEQMYQPERWTCIRPELEGPAGLLNLGRGRGNNTYQLSVGWGGYPWKSVDGNDDPFYYNGLTCSHNAGDGYSWWMIDLGRHAAITGVAVTNRDDRTQARHLSDFKVFIGDLDGPSTVFVESEHEEAVHMCWSQTAGRKYYKVQPAVIGNHVVITMTGRMMICEVEIYSNNTKDVSFPSWTLPDHALLYDNDDTTCLMFGSKYPSLLVNPFHMETTWANVSDKQDFYVNITHTADVKTLVIVKDGEPVEDAAPGSWTYDNFQGKACTLVGAPEDVDMVRTRYSCHCEGGCTVVVQVRGTRHSSGQHSGICTIEIYDEDITFPITPQYNRPTHAAQALLYDDDDSTCLPLPSTASYPLYIHIPWDPTARTGVAPTTSNYNCKQDFYVNVTHTPGVELDITVTMEDGATSSVVSCVMVGVTDSEGVGVVRSRYACFCDVMCQVLVQISPPGACGRLCTLNVYD